MKTYRFTIVITGEGNSEQAAWKNALESVGLALREVRHLPDYTVEILDEGEESKNKPTVQKEDQLEDFICRECFECDGDQTELQVDEEYMQNTHGPAYPYMPLAEWVVYCERCEEAGTIEEIGMRRPKEEV